MSRRKLALIALLVVAPIQLVGTTTAMVWFPDAAWAKVGFAVAKVLLFLAPVVWLIKVGRARPRIPRWENFPGGRGMVAAHVTGMLIVLVIGAAYLTVGRSWIDTGPMLEKVGQMGLDRWWTFALGTLYWCTINSMLEEYFWRWWVFERLREVIGGFRGADVAAAFGSAVLFTAHHIVALSVYFDARTTALASAGVFIGGLTWSLLYMKYRNIYACYVSHVWADLIIFGIGAWLIFGG
ncbi:MAG: CPBP family intramembrane glutamic endopeptidase [Planctomycetota bacterium]